MALTRRAALKGVLATTIGAVTGAGMDGIGYERHRLVVTKADLPVRGLAAAFDGLRIALLTDIHHSLIVPAEDVVRAVSLANSLRPDLTILGGDYVTEADRTYMNPVAELLAPLRAPLGVFAILGNHDDDRDMPAALERNHMEVLRDESIPIPWRGETLSLAGIKFWTQRIPDIRRALRNVSGPALLLAHDPRRLVEAAALDVPAVLSGHTHGGQIVIPGVGAPAARKFPVAAGLGSRRGTSLFVSRGVGTVYVPVRINCPPEVALITLRARDLHAASL
jgi:predicted MPP superfamily phosphohydrolase